MAFTESEVFYRLWDGQCAGGKHVLQMRVTGSRLRVADFFKANIGGRSEIMQADKLILPASISELFRNVPWVSFY